MICSERRDRKEGLPRSGFNIYILNGQWLF